MNSAYQNAADYGMDMSDQQKINLTHKLLRELQQMRLERMTMQQAIYEHTCASDDCDLCRRYVDAVRVDFKKFGGST